MNEKEVEKCGSLVMIERDTVIHRYPKGTIGIIYKDHSFIPINTKNLKTLVTPHNVKKTDTCDLPGNRNKVLYRRINDEKEKRDTACR